MITIGSFDSDRETLRPLFSLADDSPQQIALYLNLGEILVAREGELIVGYVQLVPDGTGGACEIKSIAVRQERQCRGTGTQLIDAAIGLCRGRGHRRMIVATATADISNLRFYQRQGFRMTRIVPNVFTAENGYSADLLIDGIPLRDQVWFEHDL